MHCQNAKDKNTSVIEKSFEMIILDRHERIDRLSRSVFFEKVKVNLLDKFECAIKNET